ncbi:aquaporin-9 [Spea bombifrons]|uniref:aquaporin-9 n=1 Tax=Spea bombifrons TaxID=233779 RepID=UPI00234B003B|nr:aquaporin-9 [Spea bombifrons]
MSDSDNANNKGSRRNSKYTNLTMKGNRSFKEKIALRNNLAKETLAEFFATCLLITFGCGCVASSVLSNGAAGGHLSINIGFAMAVTMAIYVSGGVSGGHINPAVSFAMCLTGRLHWAKFPFYVSAQFLGAITGSAAVFGIFHDALKAYTGGVLTVDGPNATAHIFATYPSPYLSTMNGLADQVIATALLLIGVFAIFDNKNIGTPKGLEPIAVGLLIMLLGFALGLNSGCAMNPARDLGPRIFTALAGWGIDVFTAGNNWWWVPVVGPMVGATMGAYIYILCIEAHHEPDEDNVKRNMESDNYEKQELANMA